MGVGASTPKRTSEDVRYSPLDQGGEGRNPPSDEQTRLGDGVQALQPYGTFFEPPDPGIPSAPNVDIPEASEHDFPKMSIREDRVIVCRLPEDIDPEDRERYERALFRLFFHSNLFVESPGFGTAKSSEDPHLRAILEEAIEFADYVMHTVIWDCRIEAKQFFDAAVSYMEDHDEKRPGSVLEFVEHCLSMPDRTMTEEERQARSGERIWTACSLLEDTGTTRFDPNALGYCRWDLAALTQLAATYWADSSPLSESIIKSLDFATECLFLKRHQAVLSDSVNSRHLLRAAYAASIMNAVGDRLDPQYRKWLKPQEVPVERLVPALEERAARGNFLDVRLCTQLLEPLLKVAPEAVVILDAIKTRYARSGELNRLVEALDASPNKPAKVMEFLRF